MFTYHHMGPPFYSRCCVNSMVILDSRSLVMFISSWLPKSTPEFSVKCKALVLSISGRGADTFLWRIDGLYDIQSSRKASQKEAGGACAFHMQLGIQPSLLTKPGWDSFIKQVNFDQTMTTLSKYFALWKCCQCLKKLHLDKNR